MIEVRGLVKSYGSFRALDGLDASVPDGAVYGLVGPNGAGKSTLIRHLAGIYRQDAGTVLIGGEQVYENPAVKGRIAYIPDEVFYYGQASAMDMMRFYRDMYPHFDRQRFDALGELFRLDPKCPIRRLSKGMQKQSAFWLALCCQPQVLVLDSFHAALTRASEADRALMFYENEQAVTLKMALTGEYRTVSLLTGPEGGLEEKEVRQAREAGLQVCTLGRRILRCETAPLCALSAVMYDAGEF